MSFPARVLRWESLARAEIASGGYPFPVEYPLAVCLVESRGVPGIVNPNSGASGLMQVMPITLNGYNRNNSPDIPLSHLRSESYPAEQMRVGLWVMGRYLKKGFDWISETNPNPPLSDLIKVSDLMYVAGPGLIRSKFRNLTSRLFDDLVNHDPDWQPFAHPRKVWKWTMEENNANWDMDALKAWVGESPATPLPPPTIASTDGFLGALLVFLVAGWFFGRQPKQ